MYVYKLINNRIIDLSQKTIEQARVPGYELLRNAPVSVSAPLALND